MPRDMGVGNADTIEQRARFFGYKRRYLGYCRVFLEQSVRAAFQHYVEHERDIRERLGWLASHNMAPGQKIAEQIDAAIRRHDKLLLILSEQSINSEWVKTEIAKARKRESKENRRMLFPTSLVPFETLQNWECFDADTGKDSAREIREYFIPNFSTWETDHKAYKENLDRLVKSLETKGSATAVKS